MKKIIFLTIFFSFLNIFLEPNTTYVFFIHHKHRFPNSQIEWVSFPICQGYELDSAQVWIAQLDFSIFKLNGFLSQYIKVIAS